MDRDLTKVIPKQLNFETVENEKQPKKHSIMLQSDRLKFEVEFSSLAKKQNACQILGAIIVST